MRTGMGWKQCRSGIEKYAMQCRQFPMPLLGIAEQVVEPLVGNGPAQEPPFRIGITVLVVLPPAVDLFGVWQRVW